MGFYCIFNKTLYLLLIHVALCLINDVINRTMMPSLVGEAISYYIADSIVTYTTQKKHCCCILLGISMTHISNFTVHMYNSSKTLDF